jgi:hypothetical protein
VPDSQWALVTPDAISIRNWPDGSVVFNARESTTTMLSAIAGGVVTVLMKAPTGTRELSAGAGTDAQEMGALLSALADHGIVRRAG